MTRHLRSVLILLSLSSSLAAAQGLAAPVVNSNPILFVHGFNPFGLPEDCRHDYQKMETTLAGEGFTGEMKTVSYYSDDTGCDVKTSPRGSILSNIRDLSKNLAWYIYDHYTSQNLKLEVVAHSMGGLLVRYALYRVAVGDATFPPSLVIPHVATLAVPYDGYSLVSEFCHINVLNIQCDQMAPYSSFIQELKSAAGLVPQGAGGTLWSNVGSTADIFEQSDGFVTAASATSMNIPKSAKTTLPWHMLVFHTGYTHNAVVIGLVASFLASKSGATASAEEVALNTGATWTSSSVPVADQITLSRSELDRDFSQVSQSVRPALIQPYTEDGRELGVQFTNVLAGGIFSKMGIDEGDLVRGCNSANVDAPFAAVAASVASHGDVSFDLCIVRNGAQKVQGIHLTD